MPGSLSWKRRVLSNGLVVLLYPRLSAMTAQLSVAIKYGSNDDFADRIGTAHFLEHMLVGGSSNRIRLNHEIERLGGIANFETSKECTFSIVDVFPERLSEASKVISGLIFDSSFEKDKLELERKVILNEIAEASDDPGDKTEETLLKCLFRRHPVRNPILGSKKTVSEITLPDIEEARGNYYCPRNMILILTGKFSEKEAKKVLEVFQDRNNAGSILRVNRSAEVCKPRRQASTKRSGITQAYLSFGFKTPPAKDVDIPTLELINAILGIGESSRLFVELREKRALTYGYDSVNVAGLDFGYFSVSCAVKSQSLNLTQSIIHGEFEKLKVNPVTNSELEKSKNLILSDVLRSIDSAHNFPRILTDLEMYFENENALIQYVNKIKSLTKQNIVEVANKYFLENNYATSIITPKTHSS